MNLGVRIDSDRDYFSHEQLLNPATMMMVVVEDSPAVWSARRS